MWLQYLQALIKSKTAYLLSSQEETDEFTKPMLMVIASYVCGMFNESR